MSQHWNRDQVRVLNEAVRLTDEKLENLKSKMESKTNIFSSNPEFNIKSDHTEDIKFILYLILLILVLNFILNIFQIWRRSLKKRYVTRQIQEKI